MDNTTYDDLIEKRAPSEFEDRRVRRLRKDFPIDYERLLLAIGFVTSDLTGDA